MGQQKALPLRNQFQDQTRIELSLCHVMVKKLQALVAERAAYQFVSSGSLKGAADNRESNSKVQSSTCSD
jgi:hypothetical protein